MNFPRLLSFLIIKVQIILLYSDFAEMSFCKEFEKNRFEIDFGYQRIRADKSIEYYLSSANIFWRIKYRDEKGYNSDKSLTLNDIDIGMPFETRYQMAFCLFVGKVCINGFVDSNTRSIDWFILTDLQGVMHDKIAVNSTDYKFPDFNPSIAFVANFESNYTKFVHFLEQKFESSVEGYTRVLRLYYVDDNLGSLNEVLDVSSDNSSTETPIDSLNKLSKELKIIAIFSHFSDTTKEPKDKNLFVVIQMDKVIKYCVVPFSGSIEKICDKNLLKTLIDCSNYVRPTTPTVATTHRENPKKNVEEPTSSLITILIILGLTFIPIIVLLIIGFFLFKFGKKKKKKRSETQDLSNITSNDEKENETEKSEAITIFKKKGWNSNDSDPKSKSK